MKQRIVLIDDNQVNDLILESILAPKYEVIFFDSAVKALEYFKKEIAALIVLDISMPEMDGFEFLDEMKKNKINIPVIISTSYHGIDSKIKAFDNGVIDYITKPFDSDIILAKIDDVINYKGSLRNSVIHRLNLYDAIMDIVIITDAKTNEIIYINKEGCLYLEIDKYSNQLCHKLLLNKEDICNGCKLVLKPDANLDDIVSYDYISPKSKKHFYVRGKLAYYDGRIVRVIIASDRTDSYMKDEQLKYSYECEKFYNVISTLLINKEDFDNALKDSIKKIRDFFDADNAFYLQQNNDSIRMVSWCSNNTKYEIHDYKTNHSLSAIGDKILDKKELFYKQSYKFNDDFDFLGEDIYDEVIIVPVKYKKSIVRLIGLINQKREAKEITQNFITSLANLFSSAYIIYENNYISNYDSVTGLYNYSKFEIEVSKILDDNPDKHYGIAKLDISNFKYVNDYYGSFYGDTVLKYIGEYIKNKMPEVIISTRVINSDVFYSLFRISNEHIQKEKIINYTSDITTENYLKDVYFNHGLYDIKDNSEDIKSIMAKVSLAHKEARNQGINKVYIYDEALFEKIRNEQYYISSFKNAIDNQEFQIYLQPKYDLESDSYYGAEALVRWFKNGKIIPPGNFIQLFEKNGLIASLDRYMLIEVLKIIRKWLDEGKAIPIVSINFSRIDFYNATLYEETVNLIDEYKIPHKYIQIEITESAFAEIDQLIAAFIAKCARDHIEVSMDDFGSGESSLNSLRKFSVNEIKLDYKFLTKDTDSFKREKIIESIVYMASSINLPVIAEGVETLEDVQMLKKLGVRYIQGYYFGRPMEVSEFEKVEIKEATFKRITHSKSIIDNLSEDFTYLFNEMPINAGLYKVNKDHSIVPIYQNSYLLHSTFVLDNNSSKSYKKYDNSKGINNEASLYIQSVLNGTNTLPYITIDKMVGDISHKCRMKVSLVEEKEDCRIIMIQSYLLDDFKLVNKYDNSRDEGISELVNKYIKIVKLDFINNIMTPLYENKNKDHYIKEEISIDDYIESTIQKRIFNDDRNSFIKLIDKEYLKNSISYEDNTAAFGIRIFDDDGSVKKCQLVVTRSDCADDVYYVSYRPYEEKVRTI